MVIGYSILAYILPILPHKRALIIDGYWVQYLSLYTSYLTAYTLNAERQAGKLWIPILKVFWSDSTRESGLKAAAAVGPTNSKLEYNLQCICYCVIVYKLISSKRSFSLFDRITFFSNLSIFLNLRGAVPHATNCLQN